ncbi:hypothetical protein PoB_007411300 [Plakobranchus ocellatus]|uniref:Uncharacterized protein n=1 Tax=Plakobranchus ocellatus TaxID=259542 RepID=A0AAV4DTE1_9GAST|nr:hypothetical protein PoB_007411300 [Plakobranchus ocellatus]
MLYPCNTIPNDDDGNEHHAPIYLPFLPSKPQPHQFFMFVTTGGNCMSVIGPSYQPVTEIMAVIISNNIVGRRLVSNDHLGSDSFGEHQQI